MTIFPATIAAALAGRVVRAAHLVAFDFLDDPRWYWLGFGPLRTADGQVWEGTGGIGEVDGLTFAIGTAAPQTTFKLSGVDARVIALAQQQSDRVKGREVRVYVQFLDENLALLDDPFEIWWGTLDVMTYEAAGNETYTVTASAEGVWTGRNKPPFGYFTDADQQARHPGDRGLEQVGSLPGKTITWPAY